MAETSRHDRSSQRRRDWLESLTAGALSRHARAVGVAENDVFDAMDAPRPREALVELILHAEDPLSEEARELRREQAAHRLADHQLQQLQRKEHAQRLQDSRSLVGTLHKGTRCVYFDLQASDWLPAIVLRVHADNYHVDLEHRKDWVANRVDASRIRKLTELEVEEAREQHISWRIGEHVQYFNPPSADWIRAEITDVLQNAAGRVNSVSLMVEYSRHWPVDDVAMSAVPLRQVRALTRQNAEEEEERRQVRWEAALQDSGGDEDTSAAGLPDLTMHASAPVDDSPPPEVPDRSESDDGPNVYAEDELHALGIRELRECATSAGVSAQQIEEARDSDEPKAALIALILGP
eukprot:COSAG02_NODE_8321_length_2615_cov_2.281797_2_plen_351_part_00